MRFKNLTSLEAGDDLPVKDGEVSLQWTKNTRLVPEVEKTKFVEYLKNQHQLFEVLAAILQEKYRSASNRQFDFDRPNVKESMLYNAGYLQAIRDIYNIIP